MIKFCIYFNLHTSALLYCSSSNNESARYTNSWYLLTMWLRSYLSWLLCSVADNKKFAWKWGKNLKLWVKKICWHRHNRYTTFLSPSKLKMKWNLIPIDKLQKMLKILKCGTSMWQRLWCRYYLLKSFPKKISFESDGLKKACTNNSVNASPSSSWLRTHQGF